MRQSFAPWALTLRKTPSYRQEAQRRRLTVICAALGLALASGLIGTLTQPTQDAGATGAATYIPSQ